MTAPVAFELVKQTYADWNEDKAPRLGAALAYYTVFSIAPLLLVIISIAGIFFGQQETSDQISAQISHVVGPQAAQFIQAMVEGARKPSTSIVATIIGLVTLVFGAMGVFGQLQDALNTIWEVQPKPGRPFIATLRDRFTPFVMVIGVSFLLLSSLVVSAGIAALGAWMDSVLPLPEFVMQAINFVVSLGIVTLMFALIFKVLPDVQIQWRDVWIGAGITALLFVVGQFGLAWYVGKTAASSTYGAAGSLVAVLLWVYWTSQILFFGAEFTQVYANRFGSKLLPSSNAIPVTEEARAQQGLGPRKGNPDDRDDDTASKHRNLLEEARREEAARKPASTPAPGTHARNESLEDVGAILAGLGIVLILSRLFRKESRY
jgi:membrane protein